MIQKTQASRTVLEDCKTAASELTDGISGSAWRWRWVGIAALLRAVGHVLKHEGKSADASPALADAIRARWPEIARAPIFRDFIKKSRDSALKEYVLHAGQGVTVYVQPVEGFGLIAGQAAPARAPAAPPRPATYSYPMTRGPFAGRDQREVIAEAIAWWQEQLDAIDADAAARATNKRA